MLKQEDKELLSFYMNQPNNEATAWEVMEEFNYPSVGAVNLHVVRIAKQLSSIFSYTPTLRENGQNKWWPCLFNGRDDKRGFIWKLREEVKDWYSTNYQQELFALRVALARAEPEARAKRLLTATPKAKKITIQTIAFERNPDVVAEVLERAKGICERCNNHAPFLRKSDGSPYLEVHHVLPLSKGGDDTVSNAEALCPNCHREAHYG